MQLYRECLRRAKFIGKQVRFSQLIVSLSFEYELAMSDSDTLLLSIGIVFGVIAIHVCPIIIFR